MDESTHAFLPLLLVVLLAFVVPLIISRVRFLRLPIVVGEILAGVAVGRSGLGWVAPGNEMLTLLAEFGFVFLMFLAGMEIDFSNLGAAASTGGRTQRSRWGVIPLSLLTFSLTLLLSLGVGVAWQWRDWCATPG